MTTWTEDYTDPEEEIRLRMKADRKAQAISDLLASARQGADEFVQRRAMPLHPARVVDDELKAWLAARKVGQEDQAAGLAKLKGEREAAAAAAKAKADEAEQGRRNEELNLKRQGLDLDRERLKAEQARKDKDAEDKGKGDASKAAMDLRKEFQGLPVFKATTDMADAIEKIRSAPPNGTGDLGLIYSYVKILDPGSVVREGEIQLAGKPTPLLTALAQQYSRVAKGDLLAPELRSAYKDASEKLWEAQVGRYDQAAGEYRGLSEQLGIDPTLVVRNYGFKRAEKVGPAPGGGKTVSPDDQRAIEWLKNNPADPRAEKVRATLKAKGLL